MRRKESRSVGGRGRVMYSWTAQQTQSLRGDDSTSRYGSLHTAMLGEEVKLEVSTYGALLL